MIRFVALAVLTGCSSPPSSPAELVFRGGAIYTLNAEAPWADGLAIADGRILAIGNIEAFIGEDTRVVDLDGRLLLPGFHDDRVDLAAGTAWLEEKGITPADAPTYLHRFGITSVRALDGTLPEALPLRTNDSRGDSRSGVRFASGWPATTIDPLVRIHRAVTGLDLDGRRVSREKMKVEDAVPRYAAAPLERGELADLAILSENILKIPPERIAECKVEMTVFGGRIVYQAASFDQGNPSTLK
ncbi:MAG: hypothetical protein E2P02_09430 [Acidobacteria bacterium]|nr:MAG: hypothetical protein E2P02_09430 [Acidobacteriota bacterium]